MSLHSNHGRLCSFLCLALTWFGAERCSAQAGDPGPAPPRPSPASAPAPSASSPSSPAEVPPTLGTDGGVPSDPEPEEIETSLLLIDGQRASGVLVENTPERIVLVNNGVRRTYSRDSVASVETLPPVIDRYRQMRAAISDDDLDQRLLLAQWLRQHRKYQLALDEVSGILGRDSRNPEALRMRTWLEQQLKLRSKAVDRAVPGGAVARDEARPVADPRGFPLLTSEQVNLLRVFEVDLADPPRMMIDRDAIGALINKYAADPLMPADREGREAIFRKTPAQILDLMFRLRARDSYSSVQVMSDPRSMKLFRDRVHSTWLLNSCATSRCHGGESAGKLYLATRQPNSDATVYTNFLIIDRFRLGAGPARAGNDAPEGKPLIDYEEPARSPLLQLGLNRAESIFPHPEVAASGGRSKPIGAVFSGVNDRRFQDTVEWIRSMYLPRPDYPIDYTPPLPLNPGEGVPGERRNKKDANPLTGRR